MTNLKTIQHEKWIEESNKVFAQYDFPITLRQLFYVLVTKKFFIKSEKRYRSLSSHLVKGRLKGDIKWDSLIDYTREIKDIRTRFISIHEKYKDFKDYFNEPYILPRHFGQQKLNLFFLEKDSLKPFIEPFLYPNSILVIGKGQNSWSNAFELSKIDISIFKIHLYTLVDYDLSGTYIHNSFINQLEEFDINVEEINNIAITDEQIERFNLRDLKNTKKNEIQLQALDPVFLRDLIINTCRNNWDFEIDKKREKLQEVMNYYYRKKLQKWKNYKNYRLNLKK